MVGPAPQVFYRFGPPQPNDGSRPPLKERVRALRHVPALLRMVWQTHRGYAVAVAILRLLSALIPLTPLYIGKLIIDGVVAARAAQGSWRAVLGFVLLEIAVVIGGDLLNRAAIYADSQLGDLFSNRVSVRLMEHAATLDLTMFEDPTFYD